MEETIEQLRAELTRVRAERDAAIIERNRWALRVKVVEARNNAAVDLLTGTKMRQILRAELEIDGARHKGPFKIEADSGVHEEAVEFFSPLSTPRFKPGDLVVCVADGAIGTVSSVSVPSPAPYCVEFGDEASWLGDEDLNPYEPGE